MESVFEYNFLQEIYMFLLKFSCGFLERLKLYQAIKPWPGRDCDAIPLGDEGAVGQIPGSFVSVLRLHLILIQIWIGILDPHWKKMDPDPAYFFKINLFFFAHFYALT